MPALAFAKSSTPGSRAGEGEGRLLNAMVEMLGDSILIRRTPGLTPYGDTGLATPRGLTSAFGLIFDARANAVVKMSGGVPTTLTGSLPGTDGVTWAQNANGHLIVCRSSGGAYLVTTTAVSAYPDSDLPSDVNSVASGDGYFVFTRPNGQIWASDLNSTAVSALSFATAEARPDGLKRVLRVGNRFMMFGDDTIEPWLNVGSSPFPLQRHTAVINVGLKTAMAVAGAEAGWDHPPLFVAHDGTVRVLAGYQTQRVSTADVERFIASSTTSTLEACVYTTARGAFWSLSSDVGTWEFNVLTGQWHERVSQGYARWRGSRSVKVDGVWYIGDAASGKLGAISDQTYTEFGTALTWTVESAALKEFPKRFTGPALFADFAGSGPLTVDVSFSADGGATWKGPYARTLSSAGRMPQLNRLGTTGRHGFRARFSTSSNADVSFLGAALLGLEERAA